MIRWVRIAVNLVGFVSLAAATWTGLGQLTGDRLLLHVTTAPAFAVAAVAVTACWAHRNRVSGTDCSGPRSWTVRLRSFFFWTAVVLAVPAVVSILVAMFPFAGTDEQEYLLRVHRICGPLLAAAATLFAFFALVAWRAGSPD